MSNRFSLDEAKLELRNRGYYVVGNSYKGYRVFKDGVDHTTLVTGRGVVKFAKEVLIKESTQIYKEEILNRLRERQEERDRSMNQDLNKQGYVDMNEDSELLAEMRSTWDPGTKVVNVLTGETVVI